MLEALSYEFMQNAIIAGILVSVIAGIIGSLIVVNRMVFLAGGIAYASYGGIGIAIFSGIPIALGTSLFAVLAALFMAIVTINQKDKIDIFALLTIPIYIAQNLSSTLYGVMIKSSLISTFFTISGLALSYSFNFTSGATIILVAAISLLIFMLIRKKI